MGQTGSGQPTWHKTLLTRLKPESTYTSQMGSGQPAGRKPRLTRLNPGKRFWSFC